MTSRPGKADEAVATAAGGERATVLVVEDQDDVREVMLAYLAALGHPAIPLASGRRAVDLLDGGAVPAVGLLLVDYAMPGLSGLDVARAARARRPELPVIIVSGYADAGFLDGGIAGAQLLRKPCRLNELAAAIEAALAHRGPPGAQRTQRA